MGLADIVDLLDTTNVVTIAGVWVQPNEEPIASLAGRNSDPVHVRTLLQTAGLDELLAAATTHEARGASLAWLWTQGYTTRENRQMPPDPPLLSVDQPAVWASRNGTDVARQPLTCTQLVPLGQVGVLRLTPDPAAPLHSPYDGVPGRLRPLFVAEKGLVTDPLVDPADDPLSYLAWQADMFGRWSGDRRVDTGPPRRPGLPRPQPLVHRPFDEAPPSGSEPWPPELVVTVPVPTRVPGQPPILEVVVRVESEPHRQPAAPPADVSVRATAPALSPGGAETVTVRTAFVGPSGEGPEAGTTIRIVDPRPMAPPALPRVLTFADRPDAGGEATARIKLPQRGDIASYRVYFTSETRLRSFPPPHPDPRLVRNTRAAEWLGHPAGLARKAFDALTPEPIPAGPGWFHHRLPGDLAEVVFYRLVPVGTNGASPSFDRCPTVAVAVPLGVAPPPPELAVDRSTEPTQLVLRIRPGSVGAGEYRVRLLAETDTDDPRSGVVVAAATPAGPEGTRVAVPTLRPYSRVLFVAEVRGEPEVGDPDCPGLWSAPSPAVDYLAVPLAPPDFISAASAEVTTGLVQLTFAEATRPLDLTGFSVQAYWLEGGTSRPRVVGPPVPLAPEFSLGPLSRNPLVLVVTDPLGRRGTPVRAQLLVAVPDVVGWALEAGKRALEDTGLRPADVAVALEDWSTAIVGSVDPVPGTRVPVGSSVEVVPADSP
jgi:hypothetical protein